MAVQSGVGQAAKPKVIYLKQINKIKSGTAVSVKKILYIKITEIITIWLKIKISFTNQEEKKMKENSVIVQMKESIRC